MFSSKQKKKLHTHPFPADKIVLQKVIKSYNIKIHTIFLLPMSIGQKEGYIYWNRKLYTNRTEE